MATVEEIDEYMRSCGFVPTGKTDGEYENENYIVSNVRPKNVLVSPDGGVSVVDAYVKKVNQGKGKPILEINSISTVFGKDDAITDFEEEIYRSENINPQQAALLDKPNSRQYPTIEDSSGKGTTNNSTTQEESEKSARFKAGDKVQYKEANGYIHEATIIDVNADGTYNIDIPNNVFGAIHLQNISEDRILP